jgi:hypothetical protein
MNTSRAITPPCRRRFRQGRSASMMARPRRWTSIPGTSRPS